MIRARYDGRKRSPFDEAECGHHYARAMAAWAAVLALTGFHYSARGEAHGVGGEGRAHFWSNGYAWGTCEMRREGDGWHAELACWAGACCLRRFALDGGRGGGWKLPRSCGGQRGGILL